MKDFQQCCDEAGIKLVVGAKHTKEILKAVELYASEVAREAVKLAREKEEYTIEDAVGPLTFVNNKYTEQEILDKLKL